MKIKSKIILLLFGSFSLSTILMGTLVYLFFSQYSFADFYHRLEIRASALARTESGGKGSEIEAFRREHLPPLENETDYIIPIDPSWEKRAREKGVPLAMVAEIINQGKSTFRNDKTFYSGVLYNSGGKAYAAIVSADNYYDTHHMAYMRNLLFFGGIGAILLLALISAMLTRTLVRPLRDMTEKAREISTENLHLRLEIENPRDELGAVAATINNMLDRLEAAFQSQKNFISNASHELKTPLTAIIGEADVVLARKRSSEDYIRSISTIQSEAEKLSRKIQAILSLANSGLKNDRRNFEALRADEIVIEVCSNTRRLYPDHRIEMDFSLLPESEEKLKIEGNAELLHVAISNIVGNACKYSTKTVRIALAASESDVILLITDQGIGIPSAELGYIYDPFFRASNARSFAGYGIGLPLSRIILRMHRGSLFIESAEGKGTTVQVSIPIMRRE
jgi:signal transduction histidine kinase